MPVKHVHVVINPAAGQGDFPMREFNRVMREHGVAWSASVTGGDKDGERQAREAVADGADVVAAYGGDGTVTDVARGLEGSDVPLAVLPGGSANVLASDFLLPRDITEGARLILGLDHDGEPPVRRIDAGKVNGTLFLLRLEVGMQADMLAQTEREAKEQFGAWAYWLSTLRQLAQPPIATYTIQLDDGEAFEIEAATAIVTNLAGMGSTGRKLCPDIAPDDGLLDILLIEPRHVESLLSVTRSLADWLRAQEPFPHFQAKRIRVHTEPKQTVTYDGEPQGQIEVDAHILPGAIPLITPPLFVPDV